MVFGKAIKVVCIEKILESITLEKLKTFVEKKEKQSKKINAKTIFVF